MVFCALCVGLFCGKDIVVYIGIEMSVLIFCAFFVYFHKIDF